MYCFMCGKQVNVCAELQLVPTSVSSVIKFKNLCGSSSLLILCNWFLSSLDFLRISPKLRPISLRLVWATSSFSCCHRQVRTRPLQHVCHTCKSTTLSWYAFTSSRPIILVYQLFKSLNFLNTTPFFTVFTYAGFFEKNNLRVPFTLPPNVLIADANLISFILILNVVYDFLIIL